MCIACTCLCSCSSLNTQSGIRLFRFVAVTEAWWLFVAEVNAAAPTAPGKPSFSNLMPTHLSAACRLLASFGALPALRSGSSSSGSKSTFVLGRDRSGRMLL